MVKNRNYSIICKWVKDSILLQKRKYYNAKELYYLCKQELLVDEDTISSMSQRSFNTNINKCFRQTSDTYKIINDVKRKDTKYIIFEKKDIPTFSANSIRISPRKRVYPKNFTQLLNDNGIVVSTATSTILNEEQKNKRQKMNEIKHTTRFIRQMKKSDSPEALCLFFGKERAKKIREVEESKSLEIKDLTLSYRKLISTHLKEQIGKLQNAHLTYDGWKHVIDDYDDDDDFSSFYIFDLRIKSFYLQKLYANALKYFDTIPTFYKIAQLTVVGVKKHFVDHGTTASKLHIITSAKTLLLWFRAYRNNDTFLNISRLKPKTTQLPVLLATNPDVCDEILQFCRKNLSTLTIELVQDHLHSVVIPNLLSKLKTERSNSEYSIEDLYSEFQLKSISLSTTHRWLRILGFKYERRKKSYYVDTHEKPENVRYRKEFIERYFTYEVRAYRWLSITANERNQMVKEGKIEKELGFKYNQNGMVHYEFHVDDHTIFQMRGNSLPYGGGLSVRKPPHEKPLMILGQDECIFKQYLFTAGAWVMPNGTKELIPKDEGQGVMISSFVSRELGYGFEFCDEVMQEINQKRKGQKYSDENAAIMKLGTDFKPPLTKSPLVRDLEYGVQHDGYWTYESMVIQLEDIIDVLAHTHPAFDLLFLFDHSNGHDRLQPNGLSMTKISMRHGGMQPRMRDSVLTSDEFGPFHDKNYHLQPGMKQSMQYTPSDSGPCYFSERERIERRLDISLEKLVEKKLNKSVLVKKLKEAGILNPPGSKADLQQQCINLNIPIKASNRTVSEGWYEKQKGALQILFERGWIDPANLQHYTADGKKGLSSAASSEESPNDPTGCNFSIKALIKIQNDFITELTLLQYHGKKLGCIIDRSPKCHPEIAGEGIEYVWALAKCHYRRSPINAKRTKCKFRKLVDESTNRCTVLSTERIRSCSKRARSYMKLYAVIENMDVDNSLMSDKYAIMENTIKKYSKLKKLGKTHRSVLDKNRRDVSEIAKTHPITSGTDATTVHPLKRSVCIKDELVGLIVDKMNKL